MKKEQLIVILLSVAVIILPSLLVGGGLYLWRGGFLIPFLISIACFWTIGQLSNAFFNQKFEVDIQKLKLQEIEIINEQSIETTCSYCKCRNVVPIRLSDRNTFVCEECKQTSVIIFQFATAQVTTPLQEPQLGAIDESRKPDEKPPS